MGIENDAQILEEVCCFAPLSWLLTPSLALDFPLTRPLSAPSSSHPHHLPRRRC